MEKSNIQSQAQFSLQNCYKISKIQTKIQNKKLQLKFEIENSMKNSILFEILNLKNLRAPDYKIP